MVIWQNARCGSDETAQSATLLYRFNITIAHHFTKSNNFSQKLKILYFFQKMLKTGLQSVRTLIQFIIMSIKGSKNAGIESFGDEH